MYPSRDELIAIAQLLAPTFGYQAKVEDLSAGLCFGLCCVMIEDLLTENMPILRQQLITLKQLIDAQPILQSDLIDRIPEETKKKFFEILMHHHPEAFLTKQLPEHKTYSQELMKTIHTVQSEDLKQKGGLHQIASFCGVYDLSGDDLLNCLRRLKESFDSLPAADKDIPFALLLSNTNDATLLGYDPTHPTEPWFFCDFEGILIQDSHSGKPEYSILIGAKLDDIETLAPALKRGLSRKKDDAIKDYVISFDFYCLGNDRDCNAVSQLANALRKRRLTIADSYETTDPYGRTALDTAAGMGDIEAINVFIQNGIDINWCNKKKGWSALLCAAQSGYIDIVHLLIHNHAKLDLCNFKDGFSALMYAVESEHTAIVRLLIENKAKLDLCNHQGCSALMIAAYKGHTEIAALLIEKGANTDLRTPKGYSALMFAAQNGHYEIATLLIEKHPSTILDVKDKYAISPLLNLYQHLLPTVLDYLCREQYALYNNIDPLKEYLETCFFMLSVLATQLTEENKECLVKLYIVLHDNKEREIRQLTVTDLMTFFKSEYAQTVKSLTSIFKRECTYDGKREAALQLLTAIPNGNTCPRHPALDEGELGKIALRCFPNKADSSPNGSYSYRILSAF